MTDEEKTAIVERAARAHWDGHVRTKWDFLPEEVRVLHRKEISPVLEAVGFFALLEAAEEAERELTNEFHLDDPNMQGDGLQPWTMAQHLRAAIKKAKGGR